MNANKLDAAILIVYMAAITIVGCLFARKEKETLDDFLLADRKANKLLVGVSIFAALFSGATYLGAPAEVYAHSFSYTFVLAGLALATVVTIYIFLPRLIQPGVFSAYEFLERRSAKSVRLLGALAFLMRTLLWLGVAVYAPALALQQLAGVPLPAALIANAALATIYTALGGMRGVLWTDLLQSIILIGGQFTIVMTIVWRVHGGLAGIMHTAASHGKFALSLSLDPRVRVTLWALILGGGISYLIQTTTDQISVQRYLSVRDQAEARQSLWIKLAISIPVVTLFYFSGVALYAFYRTHPDPLATGLVQTPDQILPYFVRHELPAGLPGLLAAALSSASMSAVSGGLNAMVTVTLTDIPAALGRTRDITMQSNLRWARILTVIYGLLVLGLSFVAQRFGTLVQAAAAVIGVAGGPLLGIFVLALLPQKVAGWVMITAFAAGSICVLAVVQFTACSFLWYGAVGACCTAVIGLACHLASRATVERSA